MLWVTFSPVPECVVARCWNFKIWSRRGPRDSMDDDSDDIEVYRG